MSNSDTNSTGNAPTNNSNLRNSPENDDNITGSSEALAEGISTMVATIIRDFDYKAEDASRSQTHLFSALDRLTSVVVGTDSSDWWWADGDGGCRPAVEEDGNGLVEVREHELDQLLEDVPLPFIMQHATKLSNIRKRVSSLNAVLRSVQHRLDNIDCMMSIGSIVLASTLKVDFYLYLYVMMATFETETSDHAINPLSKPVAKERKIDWEEVEEAMKMRKSNWQLLEGFILRAMSIPML
uniref:Biogenesis of lysosome-related organelles complex 1 subunit 7 n=1 Tax=Chenopodium quinoa TaxID=63459 RepID=A0A803NAL8_CHEQI